jgi:hypothetical protein
VASERLQYAQAASSGAAAAPQPGHVNAGMEWDCLDTVIVVATFAEEGHSQDA